MKLIFWYRRRVGVWSETVTDKEARGGISKRKFLKFTEREKDCIVLQYYTNKGISDGFLDCGYKVKEKFKLVFNVEVEGREFLVAVGYADLSMSFTGFLKLGKAQQRKTMAKHCMKALPWLQEYNLDTATFSFIQE